VSYGRRTPLVAGSLCRLSATPLRATRPRDRGCFIVRVHQATTAAQRRGRGIHLVPSFRSIAVGARTHEEKGDTRR
jgi:hypothetical protein